MDQIIGDFMVTLSAATSATQTQKIAERFFKNFGFEGVFYGISNQQDGLLDSWVTQSLSAWSTAYHQEADYICDPLFSHLPNMPSQFYTGADFMIDYPYLSRHERAVILRAESFGLTCGIAISVPCQNSSEIAGWNFITPLKRTEFERRYRNTARILQMSAILVHLKLEDHRRDDCQSKQYSTPHLTPREQECLLWLGSGLRTNQIAWKMGIKAVTVDMHIRNARLRLGANTREHALAIALTKGLIKP
ncbi:MAG: autoinducer binding domain-containing protein [Paracoccaceae bacterium]